MKKKSLFFRTHDTTCTRCGYLFAKEFIHENKPSSFVCDACNLELNKSDSRQTLTINNITIKLDDIFVSSWGYEQTNVNFYQVLGFKGSKTVLLREINKIKTPSKELKFTGTVKPIKNNFKPYKILTKQVKAYGKDEVAVNIDSCQTAFLLPENETMEYSEYY